MVNHTEDRTLPDYVSQHCILGNEFGWSRVVKAVVVVKVSKQKNLALIDLLQSGYFACCQKAVVSQVECYEDQQDD